MFGYVTAEKEQLTPEEWLRYRSAYCGLCRTLEGEYGQVSRLTLTYDMTFLVLLLSSLYEPEETAGARRCPAHPGKPRSYWVTEATGYAAGMNVALAYEKSLDDWRDDRSLLGKGGAAALKKAREKAQKAYPAQCAVIREELTRLQALEAEKRCDPDQTANCFGRIMAALLCWKKDRWSPLLEQMGLSLGRFIYLMDAWEDLEKDLRKGRYNPLKDAAERPDFDQWARDMLMVMLGDCTAAMEQLPLVQDVEILRKILYSGVWSRYAAKMRKKMEKERGKGDEGSL